MAVGLFVIDPRDALSLIVYSPAAVDESARVIVRRTLSGTEGAALPSTGAKLVMSAPGANFGVARTSPSPKAAVQNSRVPIPPASYGRLLA